MRRSIASSLLCLSVSLGGCSSGAPSIVHPFAASPSSVVKTYYMSCNAGEYSKFEETLSTDSKKAIHGDLGALMGGVKGLCDKESHIGTITNVDVTSENIRGEGAVVVADIHYKDNTSRLGDKTALIKEDGIWKIASGAASR